MEPSGLREWATLSLQFPNSPKFSTKMVWPSLKRFYVKMLVKKTRSELAPNQSFNSKSLHNLINSLRSQCLRKNDTLSKHLILQTIMKSSKKLSRTSTIRSVVPAVIRDIVIEFDKFTEMYQEVNIAECLNESKQLLMNKLIRKMQKSYNLNLKTKMIKYYMHSGNIWLKCPSSNVMIECQDYNFKQIWLRITTQKEFIDTIMEEQMNSSENQEEEEIQKQAKCRRLKERKIKTVIEKVLKWRELYAGEDAEPVSLDQGAQLVKVSKKTLDDYLSQIKKGKKYGFNFDEHKNQKIGVLRQYIRKNQRKKK